MIDAENPMEPDESYDAIVCRHLVWTLTTPEQAFAEWHRMLKPGGALLFFDGDWAAPTRLGRLVHRQCIQPGLPAALRHRCVLLGNDTGHLGAGDMLANLAHIYTENLPTGAKAILITTGAGLTASCLIIERLS